jgi:hypothetical protein
LKDLSGTGNGGGGLIFFGVGKDAAEHQFLFEGAL